MLIIMDFLVQESLDQDSGIFLPLTFHNPWFFLMKSAIKRSPIIAIPVW